MVLDLGSAEPHTACLKQSRRPGHICPVEKMGCGSQMRPCCSAFLSRKHWKALLQRSSGNPGLGPSPAS